MEILLLFLLAVPLLLFLIQKHRKHGGLSIPNTDPPGPSRLPFIGNLHQLDTSALHHYLWKLSTKYGPLISLKLGSVTVLVVSSAKMANEVLKNHDREFAGRPLFFGSKKVSRNGMDLAVAPYGDYWREMRKICVVHLLSSKRVQSFRSIREDEVFQMIKKISKLQAASDSKQIFNLSELLLSLTSAIISRIAFGRSYDYEEGSSTRSKFHTLLNEVQAVTGSFFFSDYFPCMSWVDKLTGMSTWVDKTCKELDLFLQEIIDEHLDENRIKADQEDITDVLIHLLNDHSFTIQLTLDHIKAVLADILVAGTDTSAASLVWAMTELIRNPRVVKKLQEEIRNTIKSSTIDESDLEKLTYLRAVVKEALRMHPPAPLLIPHETTDNCNVCGYEIQPKTVVYINAWAIGRDPESWKNPEDFLPERFLGSSIDFKGQDFEFIPFGAGRRSCPGIYLGVVTVELALANLIYSFNWELPAGMRKEDIDTDVKPGVTMHKKNELCLVAHKYSVSGPMDV